MPETHGFPVAIFAHNISSAIGACIESILSNPSDHHFRLFVLANGCTDSTEKVVRGFQAGNGNVHLVSIPLADKANAWNHYVHEMALESSVHFFMDGDVTVEPGALSRMVRRMEEDPTLNAVGGVPSVGRGAAGWRQRMIEFGRISGGLYVLRGNFLQRLRQKLVKLPAGFIGEDFLVSALAKDMLSPGGIYTPSPLLQIEPQARFSFRQSSPFQFGDYLSYFRRLVRYRIRDYQLAMLMHHLEADTGRTMPESVDQLYANSRIVPAYYWRGTNTLVDWLAVSNIRRKAQNYKAMRQ